MASLGGKYAGIYTKDLQNNDISYFIAYRNELGKSVRYAIGKKSTGMNKSLALSVLSERKRKIRHKEYDSSADKKSPTLHQLSELFFRDKKVIFSANSHKKEIEKYNSTIAIQPFEPLQVARITKEHILDFIEVLQNKGLAKTTIFNYLSLVKRIINHAINNDYYSGVNIVDKVSFKRPKNSYRLRFFTYDELDKLYEALREKKSQNFLKIVKLGITTGARAQAILNMRFADIIDWDNGVVELSDFKKDKTYKGIIADTELLEELKEEYESNNLKPNDYITRKADGAKYQKIPEAITTTINRLFNENITDRRKKAVFHSLRHTTGSLLAINNISSKIIQKVLNHSSIEQTAIYSKLADDSGQAEVRDMIKGIKKAGVKSRKRKKIIIECKEKGFGKDRINIKLREAKLSELK